MNREGRQSHVVRCLGRHRHHHHRRHPSSACYGIHHRRRGDRVRPCCLRWYAWGRVVHPRRGLHCDGRGCCVRGGFPDGHWPVEAVRRRSEEELSGVGHGRVQMPVERCRDLHHHPGQHGSTCVRALAAWPLPFPDRPPPPLPWRGLRSPWPWAALLVRMRSIISERAALAAACITSRLGGLPAPPQMSGGPWRWARPFAWLGAKAVDDLDGDLLLA